MKIHHATAKRAKKFGITLSIVENDITATKDGKTLASGPMGNKVLEQAIAKLATTTDGATLIDARIKKLAATRKKVAKKSKRKAKRKSREDGDEEDEGEGDEEGEGASVVTRKYKRKYKPFKMTCGDGIVDQIARHVKVKDDETGKLRVDPSRLVAFAKANGCWDPAYKGLNIGMQRMNVVNRLRGKVRRDKHKVVWA